MSGATRQSLSVLLAAGLVVSKAGMAEDRPSAAAGIGPIQLQEVIVTATKRPDTIQNTPLTVTALTSESLTQIDADSFSDYVSYVPGLSYIDTGGPSHQQLIMRGISTGSSSSATVGVLVDDVPFGTTGAKANGGATTPDLLTFDLDRIEVLEGPQGTLYGPLTMGGLIKYVPRAPNTEKFASQVELGMNSVDHGTTGYDAKGMVNVPLVSNELGLRVVAYHEASPDYIDNVGNARDHSFGYSFDGGRAALLFTPTDKITITVAALLQDIDQTDQPIEDVNLTTHEPTYCDLCRSTPGLDRFKTRYELYSGKVDWNLDFATLTSVTGYQKLHQFIRNDFSEFLSTFVPIPDLGFYSDEVFDLDKTTEELRLTSPTGSRLEWLVGGFYDDERNTGPQEIYAYPLPSGFVPPGLNPLYAATFPSTFREYAGFGDLTYHLTPSIAATVGARYSKDDQTFSQSTSGLIAGPPQSLSGTSTTNSVTYMFNTSYNLSKDRMVYVHVASGYRPGGANLQPPPVNGAQLAPLNYGPDKLWNYEVGAKTKWLNGRLIADASLFVIDWQDIQIQVLTPGGFAYYANAGAARSKGAELSTLYEPLAGLTVGLNTAYTEATVTSLASNAGIGAIPGEQLPHSPRWTAAATADEAIPLSRGLAGTVGASYRYVGDQFEGFQASPGTPPFHMAAYGLLDLRAGIQGDAWKLTFFVKNVTDKRAQIRGFTDQAAGTGRAQLYVNEPRNFDLVASMSF